MRLKDGQQGCPKCEGKGCYWCRKTGIVVQCPRCANSEHELVTKSGNEFTCMVCKTIFAPSGKIVKMPS